MGGTVLLRDYENKTGLNDYDKLKKKLFQLGFDGIWFTQIRQTDVPPLLIQTQNSRGITVAAIEANKEVYILKGYPFRYKDNQ